MARSPLYGTGGSTGEVSTQLVPESPKHFFKELSEVEAKKMKRVIKKKKRERFN